MNQESELSYRIPFTSKSSLAEGFHVSASLGGGVAHAFCVDTGSVGILVPRQILGPDYRHSNGSPEVEFKYASSGKSYYGQWIEVPVVLGVPAAWDGTGDYPTAHVDVFAVDWPAGPHRGVLGVGFAIGGQADGGCARNPLLHLTYRGTDLSRGYIISTQGIDVGLTQLNRQGFALVALDRDAHGKDWLQPSGSVDLKGDFSPAGFSSDWQFLMDTGIPNMILWVRADQTPPKLPDGKAFPPAFG